MKWIVWVFILVILGFIINYLMNKGKGNSIISIILSLVFVLFFFYVPCSELYYFCLNNPKIIEHIGLGILAICGIIIMLPFIYIFFPFIVLFAILNILGLTGG